MIRRSITAAIFHHIVISTSRYPLHSINNIIHRQINEIYITIIITSSSDYINIIIMISTNDDAITTKYRSIQGFPPYIDIITYYPFTTMNTTICISFIANIDTNIIITITAINSTTTTNTTTTTATTMYSNTTIRTPIQRTIEAKILLLFIYLIIIIIIALITSHIHKILLLHYYTL